MKTFLLVAGSLIIFTACAHYDTKLEDRLYQAVQDDNFFRVRELLQNAEGKMATEKFLYYSALSDSKFDRCELSNRRIDSLLGLHNKKLADSTIVEVLATKASNFIRLYQYKRSAEVLSEVLTRYESELDSAEIIDCQSSYSFSDVLAHVPPQRMTITRDETIPACLNQFKMLEVPVSCGGVSSDFVFDTGANYSTISESSAKRMKLKIMDSSMRVGTSTSVTLQSNLAVADTLFIGGILFENVVFIVLPDEQLNFPQFNFSMNGIIGFPVMYQMTEIRMHRNGAITVPQTPVDRKLNNMFLDFLQPVVALYTKTDTLLFNLDTGAKSSELSQKYYAAHKEEVERLGTKTKRQRGGAGGTFETEVYKIPDFDFTVGSRQVHLPEIDVLPEEQPFLTNKDGNLGQDVVTRFDRMILNFKYMYIDFDMDE